MAMDHLSVPATPCDCERCFSSAKHTVTCDRNSLSPAVIEARQLQRTG
ncbi:transposase-like protein [Paraphaeosphaeria sporulosa]